MSLLDVHRAAAARLAASSDAFAEAVVVTSPAGDEYPVNALVADIMAAIDTETQMQVTSRQISVVISDQVRADVGMGLPVAVRGGQPWRVTYRTGTWKAFDVRHDRTLGLTTMFLEATL